MDSLIELGWCIGGAIVFLGLCYAAMCYVDPCRDVIDAIADEPDEDGGGW